MKLLLLIPLLLLGKRVYSQSEKNIEIKELIKKYPDKNFYSSFNKDAFEFELEDYKLQIKEEVSTELYCTLPNANRWQTIFYDEHSEVKEVKCKSKVNSKISPNVIYTNYQSDDIFHDDLKLCAYEINIEKEDPVTMMHKKVYKNPRLFTRVFFNEDYPCAFREIKFTIPSWLNIEIQEINFKNFEITKTEHQSKNEKEITYQVKNLSDFPEESNTPGIARSMPHLLIFIKSYNSGKETIQLFNSQKDVYDWSKKLIDDVKNNTEELKPVLNQIIRNETDSMKQIEKIFYWVQDNVRYIAFEDGIMAFKPANADKVCGLLYGDCKGMANLTKTFLKIAGFDAHLVWIGTKDIPYNNDLPTLSVYNHMICALNFRGKRYFLDATENYIAINDYAERIQGRPVMIENGMNYIIDKIPEFDCDRNFQNEKYVYTISNNELTGKADINYKGETKTEFLRYLNDNKGSDAAEDLRKYYNKQNENIYISKLTSSDVSDRSKDVKISYSFSLSNSVLKGNANDLLVLLNKNAELSEIKIDSTRVTDYNFHKKYSIQSESELEIPSGYTASYTPESYFESNMYFTFDLKYTKSGNKISLKKVIKIKKDILPKSAFENWNACVKKINQFYNQAIILKKV